MTKAILVHEVGGPEVMHLEEITLPPPGEAEVLVRNRAIGVNFIDTYFRQGHYKAPSLPFVPGNEAAGEILALGPGVTQFKIGDRVAYVSALGGYAEERIVPADRLVKLPKSISYETAAAMMLKGLTAQYLLRQTFKVKKGHVILVHAAAGGVGLLLCQWANALGAEVIGTVGSDEKAKLAKKAGAKHVILYREEDFVARVQELTRGKLCDVVYDGVGKATFPGSLDCLAPLGMFVSFGSASGPIEAFDIGLLASKGSLFATRPTLNTYTARPKNYAKMAKDLFRVVKDGTVKIAVHEVAPLADAVRVHQALQARETTGATVLVP
ncbi:quinone oxidoreductase family protein [Beijerinckia indica]|uniref:Alcohol dehydrogenase zinc-binding domain protein n=1 Tax=Beijerinckia indica subsp. indica (strain ATCC 9039 / DSM 1715 / NCIMB 8712) TaxID=395963 RepID=B2IBG4_BEII9|nr:quinone oxidoreductase [Beijerinckia indica]ACB96590.1 Alcohol dehydrogenase zinc-binding domain protein [Beijerinckia indica subsp. indica ATCC 9039]